jgi:hypothetical protein
LSQNDTNRIYLKIIKIYYYEVSDGVKRPSEKRGKINLLCGKFYPQRMNGKRFFLLAHDAI